MSELGKASAVTLNPIMRVVFEAVQGAERAGASVWDGLAVYASTEERASLNADGLKRAVQAQIEAAAPMMPADWTPNTNSTFRIYRKLIQDARQLDIKVALTDTDGVCVARSVGDVRADVKAAKDAAKAEAGEGEGEAANGSTGVSEFDALPPDERITAALGFVRKAYAELSTLEAKALAREAVKALLTEMGG